MIFYFYSLLLLIQLSIRIDTKENVIEVERFKRAIAIDSKYNFKNPVRYYIALNDNYKEIQQTIKYLSKVTCLKFKQKNRLLKGVGLIFKHSNHNEIINGLRKNRPTVVQLNDECLSKIGCVKHHFALALGLVPHNNRWDRDDYIKINYKNLLNGGKKMYKKVKRHTVRIFNTPFDYGSITNFVTNYFSKPEKRAYESKYNRLYNEMLGQRVDFTHNDIKLINDIYCSDSCFPKVRGCLNGGYPDPNNCGSCRCPPGYTTTFCGHVEESTGKCDRKRLVATSKYKTLKIRTSGYCNHLIMSKKFTKIEIIVVEAKTLNAEVCTPKNALEIRNRYNKGATGIVFCGRNKNIRIPAIFSQVLVRYQGVKNLNYFAIIKYRAVR